MREFIINKNDAGQRTDKFITKAVPLLPKNLMYKYIRLKRIKINGKRCEISTRLCEGDVMQLYINDEFFENQNGNKLAFFKAPALLNIVYEDENIMLLDKKCGLVVHEDESGTADTLINRVLHYLYEKGEYAPENEHSFTPALCNRIDRNTGGIVICAKNAESLRILNQKIKDREIHKRYLCITVGIPPKKHDVLKAYLERNEQTKTVKISAEKTAGNKTVVTEYTVLKTSQKDNLALLDVNLITGRTHQIRAHMAYMGYPLLGDGKYGINQVNREFHVKTQALYSYKTSFEFTTDAGILSYLNGREFSVDNVWFKDKFFE
ncbi:MAG: pseudouridine synthase [Oscillospiraceae bacterium]